MSVAYDYAASLLRMLFDRHIDGGAVLDTAAFPDAGRFVRAWTDIQAEAFAVARDMPRIPRFHEIMREQYDISANDARDWRMFIMQAYGQPFPRNLSRCPTVASIVATSPDVLSASLSFLAPGKHIPRIAGRFAASCAAIWCCRCRSARTARRPPC